VLFFSVKDAVGVLLQTPACFHLSQCLWCTFAHARALMSADDLRISRFPALAHGRPGFIDPPESWIRSRALPSPRVARYRSWNEGILINVIFWDGLGDQSGLPRMWCPPYRLDAW